MSSSIAVNAKILALSPDGNLLNPGDWTEDVGLQLAQREGVRLTPEHWKIIAIARKYYADFNISPIRKLLQKNIALELGEQFATDDHVLALFSGARQVNRIAGIPPSYLDTELNPELAKEAAAPQTIFLASNRLKPKAKIAPASGETVPALIQYNGKEYLTSKHGNLIDGSDWNQAFGEFLAQQEGITLTEEHWVLLNFLRKFYFEFGVTPMVRLLMKHLGATIGKEKVHEEYLYQLFPKGPARQGSRIAGLPEPQGCVD